ncbi:hypothetical protein Tco_0175218 [Tanacetum coccineum]
MLAPKWRTYKVDQPLLIKVPQDSSSSEKKPRLFEIPYVYSDPATDCAPMEETGILKRRVDQNWTKTKLLPVSLFAILCLDLNAKNKLWNLQCLYLYKVKECECLALKLSKQTESVNNENSEKQNRFAKKMLSNVLQQETLNNIMNKDLEAQMQDKENIAISELRNHRDCIRKASSQCSKDVDRRDSSRRSSWIMTLEQRSQDNYIMKRVGITIPPSYSNAEDNSGGGGGGSVDVVSVVSVTLEETSADALFLVRALEICSLLLLSLHETRLHSIGTQTLNLNNTLPLDGPISIERL